VRYNLTVQDEHTFAVGQGQWVVHNSNVFCSLDRSNPSEYDQLKGKLNPEDSVTVIGDDMDRVKTLHESLKADGFHSNIYEPKANLPSMDADRAWTKYWAVAKDSQIVDVGVNYARTISRGFYSRYYDMESDSVLRWGARVVQFALGF